MASFPKRLKEIDKNLNCQFDDQNKKFVIHYQTKNRILGNAAIMVVEDERGKFRHPDLRDIDTIMASDINKKDPKDRIKEAAQHMVDERQKDRKRAKDMIRERTIDDKIQLINTFARVAGVGKGNSAFRRVKAQARGEVY
jgi:hypothetical protein